MKTIQLGKGGPRVSRMAYGCWRIAGEGGVEAAAAGRRAVREAVEAGYTLFDHADIYGGGACEQIFGDVLRESPGLRDRLILASKCGIRRPDDPPGSPQRYDFSAEYILASCEESLRRLGVESLDVYQLHRPDFLMDPDEVAGAFERLMTAGKVRAFGVSNFAPSQVTALQRACPMPLLVNQVEISLARLAPFVDGTLDQCLAEGIVPMAWSPLAGGLLGDGARKLLPSQEGYRTESLRKALDLIAAARGGGVTRPAVALAWLMRHPTRIVPIVGSTDPRRIREAAVADTLDLTRDEWYRLLLVARGEALP
jgi:predicted oxidoreductase